MSNIVPKSEGVVTQAVYVPTRAALEATLVPLFDGVDVEDALPVVTNAFSRLLPAVQGLPKAERVRVIATALQAIASDVLTDLTVIFPEEENETAA